ncbi:MAG TPA: hypothetical protein VM165_15160, partial [Planctomycetaceae bacterium]|nr:hypothetical protein [Planctomycetaceae bacterium]
GGLPLFHMDINDGNDAQLGWPTLKHDVNRPVRRQMSPPTLSAWLGLQFLSRRPMQQEKHFVLRDVPLLHPLKGVSREPNAGIPQNRSVDFSSGLSHS